MRKQLSRITLAAGFGLALAFTFSCTFGGDVAAGNQNNDTSSSSDPTGGEQSIITCQLSAGCVNITLEQCFNNNGTPVQSCNNNPNNPNVPSSSSIGNIVSPNPESSSSATVITPNPVSSSSAAVITPSNCLVYGVCYKDVTSSQCTSSGGKSVASCEANSSLQLYCDYGPPHTDGGGCSAISNASQCKLLDGGMVTNTCGRMDRLYCDYGAVTSDGGGCFMIASQANCDTQWGRVVYQCSAASVGSSKYNSYPTLPSQPPNPPVGSGQLYCDFGPRHSDGGGCNAISSVSQCNRLDGGLVANTCGRKDRLFCDYGPRNSDGGGCFMIASQANCDTQWGRVVTECPLGSL